MQNPLKSFVLTLPPEVFRDMKVRLVLLFIFAASMALVVWSILYRLPESDRNLERQNTKIAELENQTLELELRWNPQEAEQMAGRFKQSQELLFAGQDEIGGWQAELKRQADQLAVSVNASVTRTQDCPLPGKRFSIVTATVDVRPVAPGVRTNSPYLRLLNFAQNLSAQNKRVDLMELKAIGKSNSVSEAKLDLHLWSLENLP
jgi:hypothetical protein